MMYKDLNFRWLVVSNMAAYEKIKDKVEPHSIVKVTEHQDEFSSFVSILIKLNNDVSQ